MSPFCHFRRRSIFPKPEKASEAWLAVLSMVSWVDLATWSMAGKGKDRAVECGALGNHSPAGLAWPGSPSPGRNAGRASAEEKVCLGKGWVEGRAALGLSTLLPTSPPFCPVSVVSSTTC